MFFELFFENQIFRKINLKNNVDFFDDFFYPEIKILFSKNIFLTQNYPADPKIILRNPCDEANGV